MKWQQHHRRVLSNDKGEILAVFVHSEDAAHAVRLVNAEPAIRTLARICEALIAGKSPNGPVLVWTSELKELQEALGTLSNESRNEGGPQRGGPQRGHRTY
jgi:hypothetical protein